MLVDIFVCPTIQEIQVSEVNDADILKNQQTLGVVKLWSIGWISGLCVFFHL